MKRGEDGRGSGREFVRKLEVVEGQGLASSLASQTAMIFDSSTSDHLKPWLTKTLEPMLALSLLPPLRSLRPICLLFRCDADPSALADYILALLKHNAPESELRKELSAQLDEFLEKGASLAPPFSSFLNSFA
jgi:hypothetical protein